MQLLKKKTHTRLLSFFLVIGGKTSSDPPFYLSRQDFQKLLSFFHEKWSLSFGIKVAEIELQYSKNTINVGKNNGSIEHCKQPTVMRILL